MICQGSSRFTQVSAGNHPNLIEISWLPLDFFKQKFHVGIKDSNGKSTQNLGGVPGFAPKNTSIYRSISPCCEELPSPLLLLGFSKGGAVGNLSDWARWR